MNDNSSRVRKYRQAIDRHKDRLAKVASVVALEFFNKSFQRQGWSDGTFKPWKERTKLAERNGGRNILVDSANLQNSLTVVSRRWPRVQISAVGVPYAAIHNQGGTIEVRVTQQMRDFFWAKYKETGIPEYRWMATTKKTKFTINIPQRQFMGNSETLRRLLSIELARELRQIWRRL